VLFHFKVGLIGYLQFDARFTIYSIATGLCRYPNIFTVHVTVTWILNILDRDEPVCIIKFENIGFTLHVGLLYIKRKTLEIMAFMHFHN